MKIIKFEKDGCGPCKMVERVLDELGVASEVEHVNAFDDPDRAYDFGVTMSVPATFLVDEDEKTLIRVDGYKPQELEALVAKYKESK